MDYINYLIIFALLAIVIASWFKNTILNQSDICRDTAGREQKLSRSADELRTALRENYAYADALRDAAHRIEVANSITIATVASAMPGEPGIDEKLYRELVESNKKDEA